MNSKHLSLKKPAVQVVKDINRRDRTALDHVAPETGTNESFDEARIDLASWC